MNIFVTHSDPHQSAIMLPDKHIVKMPVETIQMLSIIYSSWYHHWGDLYRDNGKPYNTQKGAFRNHPCTQWAASNYYHLAWLIEHGISLCLEYQHRYEKVHACFKPILQAKHIYQQYTQMSTCVADRVQGFIRVMPDEWRLDNTIDTITAYQKLLHTLIALFNFLNSYSLTLI